MGKFIKHPSVKWDDPKFGVAGNDIVCSERVSQAI